MNLTYYYSACVGIQTKDVSILCDPWFTDGIYDGAWYQFPKFKNPIERIGKYDYIYISHIHPDHYDPIFLKEYLNVYPDTKLVACEKYLCQAIKREGFPLIEAEYLKVGDTEIRIFFNDTKNISDIDTALAVKCKGRSIVNMNDNAYNEEQLTAIKEFVGKPDIALLGYTGAGEFPQTYYDPVKDHELMAKLAEKKKQEFFHRYRQFDMALDADINVPFAGQYVLGGKLAHLNEYRGVADATEVLSFDDKAVILLENGSIGTNYSATDIRTTPYKGQEEYTEILKYLKMDYEDIIIPMENVKWEVLLNKAAKNATEKNKYTGECFICIKFPKGYITINIAQASWCITKDIPKLVNYYPHSIIEVDPRHLFGLLTGLYHWNTAEVGSHLRVTRKPDTFNRELQGFLNYFHI